MDSRPVAVIGDVHGDATRLGKMLALPDVRNRRKYFLGDVVNRGPASKTVLDMVVDEVDHRMGTLLLGNHEMAMLEYIDLGSLVPFAIVGGLPTIRSYVGTARGDVHRQFVQAVPAQHLRVLRNAPAYVDLEGGVLLCHAGVDPCDPEDRSVETVVLGARRSGSRQGGVSPALVVCGHYFQRSGHPKVVPGCICLDTGSGMRSGHLSALLLPEVRIVQV